MKNSASACPPSNSNNSKKEKKLLMHPHTRVRTSTKWSIHPTQVKSSISNNGEIIEHGFRLVSSSITTKGEITEHWFRLQ